MSAGRFWTSSRARERERERASRLLPEAPGIALRRRGGLSAVLSPLRSWHLPSSAKEIFQEQIRLQIWLATRDLRSRLPSSSSRSPPLRSTSPSLLRTADRAGTSRTRAKQTALAQCLRCVCANAAAVCEAHGPSVSRAFLSLLFFTCILIYRTNISYCLKI